MDENRIEGSARNFGGKVQEDVGVLLVIPSSKPKAQNLYGQSADVARQTASTLDS